MLSGDRRYLDPYEKALDRLALLRRTLKAEISDNAGQVARVGRLDDLVGARLDELKASIRLHGADGFDAASTAEIAMMERAAMDRIRQVIGGITESEKSLLASRQAEVDRDESRIRLVAILIGLASFLTWAGVEVYLGARGTACAHDALEHRAFNRTRTLAL